MKHLRRITLSIVGFLLLAGLAGVVPGFRPSTEFQAAVQAAPRHILPLDFAMDCRTAVESEPNRGGTFIINGKIFPSGTLPLGTASNDPALPFNGVPPIGDVIVRGQHSLPFPPSIASFYNATGGDFVTQYLIFNDGDALTTQAYNLLPAFEVHSVVTGGTGSFRGASGEIENGTLGTNGILGTNSTGCPNATARIIFVPGSVRGASGN
jgi:hypothetical protein